MCQVERSSHAPNWKGRRTLTEVTCEDVAWILVAQGRVREQAVVKTVMNTFDFTQDGKFRLGLLTFAFSRRALIRKVSYVQQNSVCN
jgi:hypothetical protein